MAVEIIVTSIIVIAAVCIFYRNLKKKGSGSCDCGSCSSHCPNYKNSSKQ
ncbi:FeoB-associated Cys-rich membrane protein [Clostridium sp. OS1-26]